MIRSANIIRLLFALSLLMVMQIFSTKSYAIEQAPVAAGQLVKRLLPQYAGSFVFEQLKTPNDSDTFELGSKAGKIIIRGNNANAMAVGLNHYLKYYCNVSVSWNRTDRIAMPAILPPVPEKMIQTARCNSRFMLNYCTFGYTMPWWQWDDWQYFIDWMALNGINMPLAITGEEGIWYNVWKKFGLTDGQIRSFFTGPAFLPWHRMANIDHWDGPLPLSWIKGQMALQQQILKRERDLGMKPVLPAFAGHVPQALRTKYPEAKITSLGEWGSFPVKYRSSFLDPFDPLFNKIEQEFLAEQTREFGTDHIYGADPFNEVTPPSWEPSYLASVSKTIYNAMQVSDPQAKWLQMSWIFYFQRAHWTNSRIAAFLKAVPQDKMILLDYYCDNTQVWKMTDKFFGQPYLWCYLGNFGGNTMLTGDLNVVEDRMEHAFKDGGKNMWGIGSTLEGFGVNPVMIEYVFEKAWHDGAINTGKWMDNWAARRRGRYDRNTEEAWDIMNKKIMVQTGALGQGTLTDARPSFGEYDGWPANPKIGYDNHDLLKVWELLNDPAGNDLSDVYKYDMVDVGRQVIGNYFNVLRDRFKAAYNNHDALALQANGRKMMQAIHDMDALLATNSSFLLGKWINDARAMGTNTAEKQYFERDALLILTTWGQQGSELTDYANRNLSGLMNDYYGKRWSMFIADVTASAKAHKAFNQRIFDVKSKAFEWNWSQRHHVFPATPCGNSMQLSLVLYKKYAAEINN